MHSETLSLCEEKEFKKEWKKKTNEWPDINTDNSIFRVAFDYVYFFL